MSVLRPEEYKRLRERYSYEAPSAEFTIKQTGCLKDTGNFRGIYASRVPEHRTNGINLRRFERVCQSVFDDCSQGIVSGFITEEQIENLKQVSCAIVHWKMASQGIGRSSINEGRVRTNWTADVFNGLLRAFAEKDISLFKMRGVRIPTASAFLRFLFPESFGIVDSNVASLFQKKGIVNMSLRQKDDYINDTVGNEREYHRTYVPKLREEANALNEIGVNFSDIDSEGNEFRSKFRPCDIEMALFAMVTGTGGDGVIQC